MQTSFISPEFLGLAIVAIVVLRMFRGFSRELAFLLLNLTFIWGILLGPRAASYMLLFAVLGYGLALLAARRGVLGLSVGIVLYLALFVYLRRYDFVVWVLPDALLGRVISTVGLSFLFFKVVHVMVDAYSGTIGRLSLVSYLNYVFNFTTFLMGPIQRYQDYRAQWDGLKEALPAEFDAYLDAVLRVLIGLTKAYVVAPFFQDRALRPDTALLNLSLKGLLIQSYAFWAYLYLNFSGYCDVVIGIGSLFGVRPPENFNKPFLARNISDFWQRQHRSLTLWLTDYVFSPTYKAMLKRKFGSRLAAANLSLAITMLVSGLWHGTTLSFLLFGLVHGLWFVLYRTWDELLLRRLGKARVKRLRSNTLVHAGGIVLTFNATALAFVFFQVRPAGIVDLFNALVR